MAAVDQAIAIMNALPAASAMSADLGEFPLNTKRVNYEAQSLNLFDIKSLALHVLVEEMGLANPERYVWSLRGRVAFPAFTNYSVVHLNFDPVSLRPSSYVNGALYTYEIWDGGAINFAGEVKLADLRTFGYNSVAGASASPDPSYEQDPVSGILQAVDGFLGFGDYFVGLTRDDAGGFRRLLSPNSLAVENLRPDVNATGGGAWLPSGGTNGSSTNVFAPQIRPGRDKILFQKVSYDSLIGQYFRPFTVSYPDYYITNGTLHTGAASRTVIQPDILFAAADLGTTITGTPYYYERQTTGSWTNNASINNHDNGVVIVGGLDPGLLEEHAGPGVIQPSSPIVISFSDKFPYWENTDPFYLSEANLFAGPFIWGSFDGSTNAPVVFPRFGGISLDLIRQFMTVPPR